MKVFNAIWKADGELTEGYFVEKSKKDVLDNLSLCHVIACVDVTDDYAIDINKVIKALKDGGINDVEIDLILRLFADNNKKYKFV